MASFQQRIGLGLPNPALQILADTAPLERGFEAQSLDDLALLPWWQYDHGLGVVRIQGWFRRIGRAKRAGFRRSVAEDKQLGVGLHVPALSFLLWVRVLEWPPVNPASQSCDGFPIEFDG